MLSSVNLFYVNLTLRPARDSKSRELFLPGRDYSGAELHRKETIQILGKKERNQDGRQNDTKAWKKGRKHRGVLEDSEEIILATVFL